MLPLSSSKFLVLTLVNQETGSTPNRSDFNPNTLSTLDREPCPTGRAIAPNILSKFGVFVPNLEVSVQRCPCCKFGDPILNVNATSLDSKGNLRLKQVAQGMLALGQYNKFHEAVTQNLSQNDEQNAAYTNEEIRLAQQERSSILASDLFEPHDISAPSLANLAEQLSRYPQVKEAYLVRKKLQYFPKKPFYVLGIMRRSRWFESEVAEPNFVKKLMTELTLPDRTWVICINKDKAMTEILQHTAGRSIYEKSKR